MLKTKQRLIDRELFRLIPSQKERPCVIHKAMRYVLSGGKRIRPILCLACAEAAGGNVKDAIKTACAIEMIHTYSLIHDDLPSMDNDDYRRGRLTCHKKFGEAEAILTGDALLTLAFNTLSHATPRQDINTRIIDLLSRAAGTFGMIGGQAVDISSEEKDLLTLEYININKTGALIAASCKAGAISAIAKEKAISSLFKFGECVGLTFQIVDDMLDGEGVCRLLGTKGSYEEAKRLTDKAKGLVSCFGKKARQLHELADFILNRKY
jgi:geranylgeranyl diphosphate synthase type II